MKDFIVNDIEIRSESVQEIIGKPPRWIIRRGITLIVSALLIPLLGSFLYKYPDVIKANITLTTVNPPNSIIAKTSGKIDSILVADNQIVSKEQVLGIMENPANYSDVLSLKKKLELVILFFRNNLENIDVTFEDSYQLGMIHSSYAAFITQMQSYQTTIRLNYIGEQIESFKKRIKDYTVYLNQLKGQVSIYEKDLELTRKQFNRDSLLFSKGVLADNAYETSKSAYLKQVYGYKGSLANLSNTQLEINLLQQQILENKIKKTEQEENIRSGLKEKFEALSNQIYTWEQTYLLKSAIKGRVTYTSIWSSNQYIASGNIVFTVVPSEKQTIIGRAYIPISGSGKVKIGQKVNIKLDNYPYMEYGILEGIIYNVSKVPITEQRGTFYIAEVLLSNNFLTNYKIELPFHQEMQGISEIITDDRKLIHRFFEPLKALFKEGF